MEILIDPKFLLEIRLIINGSKLFLWFDSLLIESFLLLLVLGLINYYNLAFFFIF